MTLQKHSFQDKKIREFVSVNTCAKIWADVSYKLSSIPAQKDNDVFQIVNNYKTNKKK